MHDHNLYDNDDSGLFHDVRMILENEVINFMHKYGVSTQRSISTMREVLDHYERENTMTAAETFDPAELIATTLLASFSLEKMPLRAIAAASENTGVKASQIIEHLERVRLETEPQIHQ
jgi:hypothetical protein